MNSEEYRLHAQIRALKEQLTAMQTDAAWQQRESARVIEAFQNANDVLADENADLVSQVADAQLIVDGQAHLIRSLRAELACRAIEAAMPGLMKVEVRSN